MDTDTKLLIRRQNQISRIRFNWSIDDTVKGLYIRYFSVHHIFLINLNYIHIILVLKLICS